jgi:hypothetical protein
LPCKVFSTTIDLTRFTVSLWCTNRPRTASHRKRLKTHDDVFHCTPLNPESRLDTSTWRPIQLPIQWADGTCALVNDIFYLMGGYTFGTFADGNAPFTGMFSYNPETNLYATLPNPPNAHGRGSIAVVIGTTIYLIGGYPIGNTVDAYDTAAASWGPSRANAPNSYTNGPVAAYDLNGDGKIHVFNGHPSSKLHDVYDPIGNSWTSSSVPPSATQFSTLGIRSDCKIVIVGGIPAPRGNKAMFYDLVRNSWTTGNTSFPYDPELKGSGLTYGNPRENPVLNDKLFIIAGRFATSGRNFTARCHIYDMNNDTYMTIPSINGIPRDGICGTFSNNRLFAFGGRYATSLQTGSPCVDALTVQPNAERNLKYVWSPNQWSIETLNVHDPAGTTPTPDHNLATWTKTSEEYLYYWRADALSPGEGGTVGRTYIIKNVSTNTTIQHLTIAPGSTGTVRKWLDKKLGGFVLNRVVLQVQSDDGIKKPANICHTIQVLRFAE